MWSCVCEVLCICGPVYVRSCVYVGCLYDVLCICGPMYVRSCGYVGCLYDVCVCVVLCI